MIPTTVTDLAYQFTVYVNNRFIDNGWSETYWLPVDNRDEALRLALILLEARSFILASTVYIEGAKVVELVKPFKQKIFPQDPVYGLPQWGPHYNDADGPLVMYKAYGKSAKHLIRGLDTTEMSANYWTREARTVLNIPTARPAVPALATKEELLRYFFSIYKELTCHLSQVGGLWHLTPWDFQGCGGKIRGLPFGRAAKRVSLEWADWHYAPPFSFCGTVSGYQRSCRAVITHPYVNGPDMVARFYFAKPAAVLYPDWHIFWGTYEDNKIGTGITPGEQKGIQHTFVHPEGKWEYSWGYSYGDAPGIAATGTQGDFLGLGVKPWLDSEDLDEHLGAACDMPVFSLTVADSDPNTILVTSCMRIDFNNVDFLVTQVVPGWARVKLKVSPTALSIVARLADYYATSLESSDGAVFTPWPYTRTGNVITGNVVNDFPYIADTGDLPSSLSSLTLGDRILLDLSSVDAGIWVYTTLPTGGNSGEFTRAGDFAAGVPARCEVEVSGGVAFSDTRWVMLNDPAPTVNADVILFEQIGEPNHAAYWRDKHNIKFARGLRFLPDDRYAEFDGAIRITGMGGGAVAGTTSFSPVGINFLDLVPSVDDPIVHILPGVAKQLLWVYNNDNHRIFLDVKRPGMTSAFDYFPLLPGQLVQIVWQDHFNDERIPLFAAGAGWVMLDSTNYVSVPSTSLVAAMIAAAAGA